MLVLFYRCIIRLLILGLVTNNSAANDYSIEMFFTNKFKTLEIPLNKKFIHIDGKAVWKDSLGDYGNLQCYGRLIDEKLVGTNLDIFCKAKNQENKKFWFRMQRNSTDTDAGVGKTTYLYGEGKYKKFVDMKCKYASKIFDSNAIVNQRCDIR
tara:strand:+ start:141 stop:599 length:459 start_codon:yes stop_codon:yes gene_type:complete